MGYKLGTVFGYGMTEQPKEKPATNKFVVQVKQEKAEPRFVRVEVKEPEKVEPMRFILKPQDERKQSQ